eukprot:CAMPEP_0170494480 /NCGR_PEP_ID=MMETSP0208-20121228/14662_1 /TAXON_ID=197538 /ORGANISM="Strombidium inclinatum, Strain S3" /LENGTH=74 /DNA_ID=CAMNT_0010770541 /DNA_START=113 /DNA_END=337 /DNA_ORIENTATION=-
MGPGYAKISWDKDIYPSKNYILNKGKYILKCIWKMEVYMFLLPGLMVFIVQTLTRRIKWALAKLKGKKTYDSPY